MSHIVELRANDTIASMQTSQSTARRDALESWVAGVVAARGDSVSSGWGSVAGDASFRHFYRVYTSAGTLIAMDAPPATENNAQFVRLSRLFRSVGVCVPEVVASDIEHGFLLVSDLGELVYSTVYQTDQRDTAIGAALDTLIKIARVGAAGGVVPAYTAARLHDELSLFKVWLVEGLLGHALTSTEGGMIDRVWRRLIEAADGQGKVCVHRDFHSRNLLWGPDRVTRVVDFQDALYGPAAYDLASLLRDCYVRFDESEIARWRERFRVLAIDAGLPVETDPARFAHLLDLTAMQRHLKALGIFARLELRDARSSHLVDIAPVIDHLIDVAAMYPEFVDFGAWLEATIRPASCAE
jgi:aminoglycoside/choline kinase family phosphotransferase